MKVLSSILLLVFALVAQSVATGFFVLTNGSDSNTGLANDSAHAWGTIQHGASTVSAGDTLTVGPGIFREKITVISSGTPANRIILTGTRDSSGNWLTEIDPSTFVTNGWQLCPQVGSGVYSNASMPFEINKMEIGKKLVGNVWTNGDMQVWFDSAYTASHLTNGLQALAVASGQTFAGNIASGTLTFWDGIDALFASKGNVTWLRIRDGTDPNGLYLTVSSNRFGQSTSTDAYFPTFDASAAQYVTYRNFYVHGGFAQFFIGNNSNLIIESNKITCGSFGIKEDGGSTNMIRWNNITTDFYSTNSFGAWESSDSTQFGAHVNNYICGKFLMGAGSQLYRGVHLSNGHQNTIASNYIFNCLNEAIYVDNGEVNSFILGNIITNVSAHGIYDEYDTILDIYDNYFSDCNICLRPNSMDHANDPRVIHFYRNRCFQPPGGGEHIFFNGADQSPAGAGQVWVYQNSFSGGRYIFEGAGQIVSGNVGGLTNVFWVNNILSAGQWAGNFGTSDLKVWTNALCVGLFDYNIITPPAVSNPSSSAPAWFGSHNITSTSNVWPSLRGMDFILPSGSQAIEAGKDLPTTNPTLPQDSTVKVGSAWDIGALEAGTNKIVYVSQSGSGTQNGTSSANSISMNGYNQNTNGLTYGDTIVLVGTITEEFDCFTDGLEGLRTTYLFSPGAKISAPVFGPSNLHQGGMVVNGQNHVVIDGGSQGVNIECTDNGTLSGSQQQACGLSVSSGSDILIKGLYVTNIYQRVGYTDFNRFGECVDFSDCFNFTIQDCHLGMAETVLSYTFTLGNHTNVNILRNNLSEGGHLMQIATAEAGAFLWDVLVQSNIMSGWTHWDSPVNTGSPIHCNGLICYVSDPSQVSWMSNMVFDANFIGPNAPTNNTAAMFFDILFDQNAFSAITVRNSLFTTTNNWQDGFINLSGKKCYILNNTMVGVDSGTLFNGTGNGITGGSGCTILNNLFSDLHSMVNGTGYPDPVPNFMNFNVYDKFDNTSSGFYVKSNGTQLDVSSFITYANSLGWESNSVFVYPLRGTGVVTNKPTTDATNGLPQPVTRFTDALHGTNLSALGVTSDFNGKARAGFWIVGAFQTTNAFGPPSGVAPTISVQPTSVVTLTNQTATFTLSVSGDPTIFFQWMFTNGTPVTNFNQTASWTTNSPTALTNYFFCVVTNPFGSVTSAIVHWYNTNGLALALPSISVQPTDATTLTNQTATFTLTASGGGTLFYQWRYTNNVAVTNFTTGPTWTTNSVTALTNYFYCVITNSAGSATSSVVFWRNTNSPALTPPSISVQPTDQTTLAGQTATFTLTASGSPTLFYRWQYTNQTPVTNFTAGATWTTNSGTGLTNYFVCVITNAAGSVTSSVAMWQNTNGLPFVLGPGFKGRFR